MAGLSFAVKAVRQKCKSAEQDKWEATYQGRQEVNQEILKILFIRMIHTVWGKNKMTDNKTHDLQSRVFGYSMDRVGTSSLGFIGNRDKLNPPNLETKENQDVIL